MPLVFVQNALQINFESVLNLPSAGMLKVFQDLESSRSEAFWGAQLQSMKKIFKSSFPTPRARYSDLVTRKDRNSDEVGVFRFRSAGEKLLQKEGDEGHRGHPAGRIKGPTLPQDLICKICWHIRCQEQDLRNRVFGGERKIGEAEKAAAEEKMATEIEAKAAAAKAKRKGALRSEAAAAADPVVKRKRTTVGHRGHPAGRIKGPTLPQDLICKICWHIRCQEQDLRNRVFGGERKIGEAEKAAAEEKMATLRGFLGCSAAIYEEYLQEFFSNAKVESDTVVSRVGGVPMKSSCKKKAMKVEYRLLNDIFVKALTAKAGSFDAVTKERFDMMVAIMGSVKLNWSKILFGILKAMVDPTDQTGERFCCVAQPQMLLTEVQRSTSEINSSLASFGSQLAEIVAHITKAGDANKGESNSGGRKG
ncbi:hypothetical protein F511_09470 [Dorcoceras hygrometricum]|uniref:Uncharacterized protein n=1 Tax=Dorcoceras hygrometricum TaxID=472368 RepID=A0A2Z7BSI8_9LAMI|nr:hypothetical protein F511_09470 [Dorcoceras hygrometricum]